MVFDGIQWYLRQKFTYFRFHPVTFQTSTFSCYPLPDLVSSVGTLNFLQEKKPQYSKCWPIDQCPASFAQTFSYISVLYSPSSTCSSFLWVAPTWSLKKLWTDEHQPELRQRKHQGGGISFSRVPPKIIFCIPLSVRHPSEACQSWSKFAGPGCWDTSLHVQVDHVHRLDLSDLD